MVRLSGHSKFVLFLYMRTASETVVLRHGINRWASQKVACSTLKFKDPGFLFYLFTYLPKLLGLRAKLIPKREVLGGWRLCGVLQCTLHRNFLGVGG